MKYTLINTIIETLSCQVLSVDVYILHYIVATFVITVYCKIQYKVYLSIRTQNAGGNRNMKHLICKSLNN